MQANLPTWLGVNQREDEAARPRSGGPADPHAGRGVLTGTGVVSKADGPQWLDLQRDALETAGVDEVDVYRELPSGVRDDPVGLGSCPPCARGMSGRLVFGIFAALAEGELIRAVTAVRPIRLARRSHSRPGTLWRQRTMSSSTWCRSSAVQTVRCRWSPRYLGPGPLSALPHSSLPRSGKVQPERPRGADPGVTPWFHVLGQKE